MVLLRDLSVVMVAAAVNLALNFLLVPTQGIIGAAWATLITYCGLTTALALCSRRFLAVQVPWLHLLKTVTAGALAYSAAVQIHHPHLIVSICLRLAVCGAIYSILVAVFDRKTRLAVVGSATHMFSTMRRIVAGSTSEGPAE